nr:glutathione S-transferase 1-like isoform X2 [Danaus plexippus plexippus]
MMALDAMNISLTEVDVNMDKAEHRESELTTMNPKQSLPILKDRNLILCDSHAINTYIASRYCRSDYTLPEDPAGRAIVDQLLHFNSGVLQPNYRAACHPIFYENCQFVAPQFVNEIEHSYQDLENMLVGRAWFSGSRYTLGDIAIASTVSTLNVVVPIDEKRFPLLSGWLFKMSEQPFYITANKKGLQEFWKRIDSGNDADNSEVKKMQRTSLTRRSHGGRLSEK